MNLNELINEINEINESAVYKFEDFINYLKKINGIEIHKENENYILKIDTIKYKLNKDIFEENNQLQIENVLNNFLNKYLGELNSDEILINEELKNRNNDKNLFILKVLNIYLKKYKKEIFINEGFTIRIEIEKYLKIYLNNFLKKIEDITKVENPEVIKEEILLETQDIETQNSQAQKILNGINNTKDDTEILFSNIATITKETNITNNEIYNKIYNEIKDFNLEQKIKDIISFNESFKKYFQNFKKFLKFFKKNYEYINFHLEILKNSESIIQNQINLFNELNLKSNTFNREEQIKNVKENILTKLKEKNNGKNELFLQIKNVNFNLNNIQNIIDLTNNNDLGFQEKINQALFYFFIIEIYHKTIFAELSDFFLIDLKKEIKIIQQNISKIKEIRDTNNIKHKIINEKINEKINQILKHIAHMDVLQKLIKKFERNIKKFYNIFINTFEKFYNYKDKKQTKNKNMYKNTYKKIYKKNPIKININDIDSEKILESAKKFYPIMCFFANQRETNYFFLYLSLLEVIGLKKIYSKINFIDSRKNPLNFEEFKKIYEIFNLFNKIFSLIDTNM